MRNDGLAVEYHLGRARLGVHQVDQAVKHSGGEGACLGITGYQLGIHGAKRRRDLDGADDLPGLEVPHANGAAQHGIAGNNVQCARRQDEI